MLLRFRYVAVCLGMREQTVVLMCMSTKQLLLQLKHLCIKPALDEEKK